MLINPFQHTLPVYEGTSIISESLGIVGVEVTDPSLPDRTWIVQTLFAPNKKRALGGIRIKAVDQKGFSGFINQRDFEVLIDLAKPGEMCIWTEQEYPEPGSHQWFGFCADEADLEDDLHEREMQLRNEIEGVLPHGLELTRRIHMSQGIDFEELLTLFYDCDPETGYGPDPRLQTITSRWASIERNRLKWRYLE